MNVPCHKVYRSAIGEKILVTESKHWIVWNSQFLSWAILTETFCLVAKQRDEAYRSAGGVCEGQQFGWHPSQGHTRGSAAKEGEAQRGTKSRLDGGRSQKSSRQDSSLGSNSCWRQTWQSFETAWKRTTLKPPDRVIIIILPTRLPQESVNFPRRSHIRGFKNEISGREK